MSKLIKGSNISNNNSFRHSYMQNHSLKEAKIVCYF